MLEAFLREIYDKALTLELVKEASFYASVRHVNNRRDLWNEVTEYLEKVIYDLKDSDIKKASELLESAQKVQEHYLDRHKYSALIDLELIPKISEYLGRYMGIHATECGWTLESSHTGFLTLINDRGEYVHSPSDPMWESFLYAYNIFKPDANEYHILGCGLGYVAYQLWKMSDYEADIYVYEVDQNLSVFSYKFGVMDMIDNEKLHYICGDDTDIILEKFLEPVSDKNSVKTICYWDPQKYDGPYSDKIRILFTDELTNKSFEKEWARNYSYNKSIAILDLSELDYLKNSDEWLVVGSGPSLNDNESFIRESVGKRTICAVNSSFKWFYQNGIHPDICTACDPLDALVPHIRGCEELSKDVPLIADYVTNKKYIEMYEGSKYFIYSDASSKISDERISEEDIWSYGGTVSSLALEVALKFGAKKVYLIGVDLSYPGGMTHAEGVGHEARELKGEAKETAVSVEDTVVNSSVSFKVYKRVIEQQVALYPDVEIVNKSLHGAYLKGTFCGKWWEDIPNSPRFSDYTDILSKLSGESLILGWREKFYIFWQILYKINLNNVPVREEDSNIIKQSYKCIYESFKKDLNWHGSSEGKSSDSLTYIFTDEFWGKEESRSAKILELALSEVNHNKNVLIVNTTEKMGGAIMPVHGSVKKKYAYELEKNDRIKFKDVNLPYFQFPQGMPQVDYFTVFLDSTIKNMPNKMIMTSKYSLLGDFCREELNISCEIVTC